MARSASVDGLSVMWPCEALAGVRLTVLLEVLLAGGDELDGGKLEATLLEARQDGTDQSALDTWDSG